MAVLLGLLASVSWGVADFFGGLASRRVRATLAVVLSQAVGLVALLLLLPLFVSERISAEAVGWGAASGAAGGLGLLFLYRGLGRGVMSVVAPVSAVVGASLPVLVDLISGKEVGAVTLSGLLVALAALALVSSNQEGRAPGPRDWVGGGLLDGLLAGIGFGTFFVLFARTGDASAYWPLVFLRVASVTMLTAIALAARSFHRTDRRASLLLIVAGILDVTANLSYLAGTRSGLTSVVAVLASLYPAVTVLMARAVLQERLHRLQVAGLVGAGVGIALIALG